ncbi:GNAT family N-acetyltransferase [Aliiruegeria sabulilitoris]|uniref:GNAT family N-acetyltransferase n=1 Tax=Aliiruegeria sabulilitoris TaxID=1510458 RepID=UPI0009E8A0B9|nr:GNAT family N-acetyltransferase [Aliiruegeria sabulilitoris]NDR55540.1 GNAT family N-acetyltransferase [Pseudoruegeria sp. M32A2M]
MTAPDLATLFAAIDATWPARRIIELPGWRVREGAGGGQRVSTASATTRAPSIPAMEGAQAALHQVPLVMVRPGDETLDAALESAGYRIKDPVTFYLSEIETLALPPPPVAAFHVSWPPMRVQEEIWHEGGIGPERLAVMDRVETTKCAILGRNSDRPAGTAFVALDGQIAVLHALEVSPGLRRKGAAVHMMRGAAIWARDFGAKWFCVLVTKANTPANALYSSLGMRPTGGYHYRIKLPDRG